MSVLILLLTFVPFPQQSFADFTFCREGPRAEGPVHCIRLDEAGNGVFTIVSRIESDTSDDEAVSEPLVLSARGRERFLLLLEDTDYLSETSDYESERTVADLGRKTLVLEGEWGRREAAFNYSERSEVNRLVAFFDGLVAQELMLLNLDFVIRFDRLGLATVLDGMAEDFRDERFSDPAAFLDPLRQIVSDSRVVNYARAIAERLIEDIEDD